MTMVMLLLLLLMVMVMARGARVTRPLIGVTFQFVSLITTR